MSIGAPRRHPGADDGDDPTLSDPTPVSEPEMTHGDEMRADRNGEIVRLTAIGWTRDRVAEAMNVSPRTVDRVRADNRVEIRRLRDDQAEATAAALNSLVPRAIRRLHLLIDSPLDAVALGASKFIVESALRWRDAAEIEQRIRALEEGTDDHPWIAS